MPDVILGEFSTDLTPPEVTNPSPGNGDTGVAKDVNVEFDITDTEAGVDTSSIGVTVGGVDAIVGGVFETPDYDGTIVDMGGGTWHVALSTHPDLASYTTIVVTVDGQDLAPLANVMTQYSWSFETEDYEAPYVDAGFYPPDLPAGADIPVSALITFDLKDDGHGVDLDSVIVTVGGVTAYHGFLDGFQPGFTGSVDDSLAPQVYGFSIDAVPDYDEWTTYEVVVNGSDIDPSAPSSILEAFEGWLGGVELPWQFWDEGTAVEKTFNTSDDHETYEEWP